VSPPTRRSPGAGPGIAGQSAGWDTDKPQVTPSGDATGTFRELAAWAAATRRRTLELELADAWLRTSTERAA